MQKNSTKKLLKTIRTGIRLKLRAPRVFKDGKQYRRTPKHHTDWRVCQ